MRPGATWRIGLALALILPGTPGRGVSAEPEFAARRADGTEARGLLRGIGPAWEVRLAGENGGRIAGGDLVALRQVGALLPPFPTDDHLVLVNGDRVPVRELRLMNERLHFRHIDLAGDGVTSLPLATVAVFWRAPAEGVVSPEVQRRRLIADRRSRDLVLLRNGDKLAGLLEKLDARSVTVEADKRMLQAGLPQVAAVALSSELADPLRLKGVHARVVLLPDARSPGGRFTLSEARSDGKVLEGKTAFGAALKVPLSRVAALDLLGSRAVLLSSLKPAKYHYQPYLDERRPWMADGTVTDRDLRVGGSTYDRGIGMVRGGRLTWKLARNYSRFEAVVGLDDKDGRRGRVVVRVLADGKARELPRGGRLTHAGGPLRVSVPVTGVEELTLAVEGEPVEGVVNWANARVVR